MSVSVGAVQSVLLSGCGFGDGRVIGATDSHGGTPTADPVSPEKLAATMYESLQLPRSSHWYDLQARPNPLFNADPIVA